MNTFRLKITSPEGDLFCDSVVKLSVRAAEGDLAVMAGHIPFVSYVRPCDCKIELPDGSERIASITGGVLTVSKDKVILLSGDLLWK